MDPVFKTSMCPFRTAASQAKLSHLSPGLLLNLHNRLSAPPPLFVSLNLFSDPPVAPLSPGGKVETLLVPHKAHDSWSIYSPPQSLGSSQVHLMEVARKCRGCGVAVISLAPPELPQVGGRTPAPFRRCWTQARSPMPFPGQCPLPGGGNCRLPCHCPWQH